MIRGPGGVAVSRAALCPIVGKSRMIERGMKSGVAHRDAASQRHTERLDRAIEILVIDGVFIMPNARDWARHFVGDMGPAIGSRKGLDRIDGRSRPGREGIGHSHGVADRRKAKIDRAADGETAVGNVVVHVALSWIRLAPGVLMRSYVMTFGVIGRTQIHVWIQVGRFDQNPV